MPSRVWAGDGFRSAGDGGPPFEPPLPLHPPALSLDVGLQSRNQAGLGLGCRLPFARLLAMMTGFILKSITLLHSVAQLGLQPRIPAGLRGGEVGAGEGLQSSPDAGPDTSSTCPPDAKSALNA